MKKEILLVALLAILALSKEAAAEKYQLWLVPSYFRGFNLFNDDKQEKKTLEDIKALKALGANLVQFNCMGFNNVDPPYSENPDNIAWTDSITSLCRRAGVYYTISIREGPGRRDVYYETEGLKPKSTIWKNPAEQKFYASMIKRIASRYSGDSLFVGLGMILEPNPLFDTLLYVYSSDSLKKGLERNGIDIYKLQQMIIDSVRTVDQQLPIIVQNVAYSNPEFYCLMQPQDDQRIVYEFHSYRPSEYVNATTPFSQSYPGKFFSLIEMGFKQYDKAYFQNQVFKYVKELQAKTKAPIFLGEFGLLYPQKGGTVFLSDISDIAIENKWHFALWIWRGSGTPNPEGYKSWDYETMGNEYLTVVRDMFTKGVSIGDNLYHSKQIQVFGNYTGGGITITVPVSLHYELKVYDILGSLVKDLTSEVTQVTDGWLSFRFDCPGGGIFFVRYINEGVAETVPVFIERRD